MLITSYHGNEWDEVTKQIEKEMNIQISVRLIASPGSKSMYADLPIRKKDNSSPFTFPFSEAYGISPTGAVLVRPDGYVGWRAKSYNIQSKSNMKQAFTQILGNTKTKQTIL